MRCNVPLNVRAIRAGTMNREGECVVFVLLVEVVAEPNCKVAARSGQRRIDGHEHEVPSERPGEVECSVRRRGRMDDAVVRKGHVAWGTRTLIDVGLRLGEVVKRLRG